MLLQYFKLSFWVTMFWLCLSQEASFAQSFVQAQIIVPQPVPITTPELLGRTGETVLILTNIHPSNKLDIMLGATLQGNNGITGSLDPRGKPPTKILTLIPGEPMMLTGDDLLDVFSNYDIYDIEYEGIDLEDLVLNPLFPEGTYTACVMVYDYHTKELLSTSPPMNCSPPIMVRTPDPPIIIAPQNDEILPFGPFETIVFRWTAVTLPGRFFDYDFFLAEVPPGVNPYDAIESQNFWVHVEKDFPANVLLYDQTKPPLSPGTYAVRVRAEDPTGQVKVKNDGWSDVVVFQLNEPLFEPPRLLEPDPDDQWQKRNEYVFQWTNVSIPNAAINYRLQVAVDKDEVGPEATFANLDHVILDETGMDALNFWYRIPPEPGLDPGLTYYARVQAFDKLEEAQFENDGWSDIHAFTIAPPANQPNLSFACGEGCQTSTPTGSAVDFFRQNDEVRIGNFVLKLGNVNRSGTAYNGPAKIESGGFFPFPVQVELQNVQFNRDGLAISGTAESLSPESTYLPANWQTPTGNFTLPSNLRNTYDHLEATAVKISESYSETQSLPIRFGDIFMVSLRLEPRTAKANLVSLKLMGSDRFGARKYLTFGKKQVCFSPGGPAVSGSAARLPLLDKVTMAESSRLSIVIQKTVSGAPNGGTIKPIDCTGEEDIAAVGYVEMRDSDIAVKNGNSWSSGRRIYGRFATEFRSWSTWMTDINFISAGSVNNFNASSQTVHFRLNDLKGYEFETSEAIFDHSTAQNPTGFTPVVLSGYTINGRSIVSLWNGIVFKNAELKLPAYISKTNNARVEFSFPNLSFDHAGLTGSLGVAFDEYGLLEAKIGTWPTYLSRFNLDVLENDIDRASFSGSFDIPFFDERFYFRADCPAGERVPEVELIIPETNRIGTWNADVELASNSSIYTLPSLVNNRLYLNAILHGTLDFDDRIGNVRGLFLRDIGFSTMSISNQTISPFNSSASIAPITVHNFTIPTNSKKIAGYFVQLNSIQVNNLPNRDVELKFDYDFKLDEMVAGLNAETDFKVTSRKQGNSWNRRASNIIDIPIDEELPGLDIEGLISYETHSNGYHFEGDLEVDVFDDFVQIDAHAEFGRYNNFSYWGFTGEAELGTPVPVLPYINMRAFGGGAYYRMVKKSTNSASINNIEFDPKTTSGSNFGILANVALEAQDPTVFNGRFLLEVDLEDWSLSNIRLSGVAHFLDEPRSSNFWKNTTSTANDAQIKVDGELKLDWYGHKSFYANFGYDVNMKPNGILRGSHSNALRLYFSPSNWYVRLGTMNNPIRLSFRPGMRVDGEYYSLGSINTSTYFMADGNNVRFGLGADYSKTWYFDFETGFANRFGARTEFEFEFNGGFGTGLTYCSNHPSEEWFAYLDASIDVSGEVGYYDRCDDYNPLDWFTSCGGWRWTGASFGLEGKVYMPNPTGFSGSLELGAFGFETELPFRLGGRCN